MSLPLSGWLPCLGWIPITCTGAVIAVSVFVGWTLLSDGLDRRSCLSE